MTSPERDKLIFRDDRRFSLITYVHGHSIAVVRGFPDGIEDLVGNSPLRVLDVFFAGVERISCWKDFGRLKLRIADGLELAEIAHRVGRLRGGSNIYMLAEVPEENYIISAKAYWAEYDLPIGAPSPFISTDETYKENHPPVGGRIHSA